VAAFFRYYRQKLDEVIQHLEHDLIALGLNVSLRRNSAQAMRASLLANATTAAFLCILARSARNHPPSGVSLLESAGRTALAPWISRLRR
jgi:hypothetical protein